MDRLKAIVNLYSKEVFYKGGKYSQFTIDVIEELEQSVNEDEMTEGEGLGSLNDFVGSSCYQIDTIIEVLKEGEDKILFEKILEELRELDKSLDKKK